jgi:transposase
MEEILDLYERPYENARPLVCFDEKPVELHAHVRPPLAMRRTKPKRRDYEYKRCGMRNVFLFLEPKAGKRHTLVTQRRTKEEWAKAMRYLVDELYPEATRIDVVMDNLNTHTDKALIEIFGKAEADRIMQRLVFHYTPRHGSWLNMAEIELSVMARQCTHRRLGNAFTLATELVAWEQPRNDAKVTIRWKFTTQDARRVFAKYYPDPAISGC